MAKETHQPPRWALSFFRWYCNRHYLEDLEGDLFERFDHCREVQGSRKAKLRFWLDVLVLFRPSMIKKFWNPQHNNSMIPSHLLMAVRNARREKTFSILNVIGLAIGLSACLYIGMYSLDEFRYDTFHHHAPNIYRINQTFIWGDTDNLFGSTGPGVMPAIQAEIPEFEVMTRVHPIDNQLISASNNNTKRIFEEERLYAVDSTFLDVFTFPLIKGNPQSALTNPNSIVLTATLAQKYFGDSEALGQQIVLGEADDQTTYQVTGIAADVPGNSHIQFNALISLTSIPRMRHGGDTWWWTTFVTFGRLRPDADPRLVAKKVAQVPGKYLGAFLQKYQGITYEEFLASGEEWDLFIQPYLDIRLYSHDVFSRLNQTSDIRTIYILSAIAGLILCLSVINFINLTTARATKRAKEIGIRKTLGSLRQTLIFQFLIEAIFFCAIATVLSFVLIGVLLPFMDFIAGKALPIQLLFDPIILVAAILAILIIGIFAGIYPALVLSGFRPLDVLKGKIKHGIAGVYTRNTLVVLQFTVSIGLIASALIIRQHVTHWMEMDLGFNRSNKLIIEDVNRLRHSAASFQESVAQISGVKMVSFSSDTPPYLWESNHGFRMEGMEKEEEFSFMTIDEHFVDMYGVRITAGEGFSGTSSDQHHVLVDESVIGTFEISDPNDAIGRTISYENKEYRITGVFSDLITEVNWEQLPILLFYEGAVNVHKPGRVLSITLEDQVSGTQLNELLQKMEQSWSSFSENNPFRYSFSDQEYEQIFAPTIRLSKIVHLYAILAIFIAGLGLTGLLAYMIERRNKELGVRKVLGAPVLSLLQLLTVDFARLLGIGFVLASASTWWIMNRWSEEFKHQVAVQPWTFLWAGLLMLGISVFILSFQSVRAALSNPIKYLREE